MSNKPEDWEKILNILEPVPPLYSPHVPTIKQKLFLRYEGREALFGGAAGGGKGARCPDRASRPNDGYIYNEDMETKVLTPFGFKLAGDIKVGDKVCNPDGSIASVVAVHDMGQKQFYKVTMLDGSTVEASDDHLWAIWISGIRKNRKQPLPIVPDGLSEKDEWNLRYFQRCRIVTTEQLRELVLNAHSRSENGERAYHVQIPLTNPVKMTTSPGKWPVVPPYTMGVLLGDGCISSYESFSFSGNDQEIADEVVKELSNEFDSVELTASKVKDRECVSYYFKNNPNYIRKDLWDRLEREGLSGTYSHTKFIPKRLKNGPVSARWSVIQGLFDTDGYMDDRGHVEYVTTSKQLALDVQYILRSLGFTATLNEKMPTYEYKGEKLNGKLAYRIYVQGKNKENLFRLERKRSRVMPWNGKGHDALPGNRVVSVEPTVMDNCKCITVDNPNHLYITDDFIVTHNSDALLMAALQYPLSLDTLIPTKTGWTTVKNIEIGENVFDEEGNLCQVTAKTPISYEGERYKLIFSDNSSIICDGNHLWPAETSADRMSLGRGTNLPLRFVTASEMYRTQQTEQRKKKVANWSIRMAKPLELPSVNLPVDPYILGAWLGDGSKSNGTMAGIDPEIKDEFKKIYKVTSESEYHWYNVGLQAQLRTLGVLNNKHVPTIYLRSSKEQRLALLQGLMDTDGTVSTRWGQPRFSNTDYGLIKAVQEIVHSLGWQSHIYEEKYTTKLNNIAGVIYHINFIADEYVFRLCRKKEKQKQSLERKRANIRSHKWRIVKSIEKIETKIPVQCITVNSPNSLFLVGESMIPTHNCDVPGYAAMLFRKTFTDLSLPNAIMDRSHQWLDNVEECRWHTGKSTWIFKSGATITFGYLDKPQDHLRYQGAEIQFCVEKTTPILMADGSYKEIQNIKVGDRVKTLDGPRTVLNVINQGKKKAYGIKHNGRTTYVSSTHKMLEPNGTWVTPEELQHISYNDGTNSTLLKPLRLYNPFIFSSSQFSYIHPYTKELKSSLEPTYIDSIEVFPASEMEMFDLTVDLASHYIASFGLINGNCGFDEVTHIREEQYLYLFSRLRKPSTGPLSRVPLRMRAASNPAPNWVRKRFIEEASPDRVFIPSTLDDNPYVHKTEYLKMLDTLDPVTKAQLEKGDWYAAEEGAKFRRDDFKIIRPEDVPDLAKKHMVRYWDLASTEKTDFNDPDFTAGALVSLVDGYLMIHDIKHFRHGPAEVERLIAQTAREDGPEVKIRIEQEGGATGKMTIDHFARHVLLGYDFDGWPATKNKESRIDRWAPKARRGEVILVQGNWIREFIDEAVAFGAIANTHDDQLDAISGAYEFLAGLGKKGGGNIEIIL